MAHAITISITAMSKRINATPQAIKRHLKKLNVEPIGFADIQRKRPLYSAHVIKKMDGCKRRDRPVQQSKITTIRMTEDEHTILKAAAKKNGMPLGKFLKQVASRRKPPPQTVRHMYTVDPVFTRQVAMIGNNINQISKSLNKANKAGVLSTQLAMACFATLADIDDQITTLSTALQYDS